MKKVLMSAVAATAICAGVACAQDTQWGPTTEMAAQGLYFGLDLGAADVGYQDSLGGSGWKSGNWTMAVGGDAGYQFDTYMAIEGGGYYFLSTKKDNGSGNTAKIQPWAAYAAVKLMIPVAKSVVGFAKVGMAYQNQSIKNGAADDQLKHIADSSSNWSVMFAAGAAYVINYAWSVDATYTLLPGVCEAITVKAGDPSYEKFIPVNGIFTAGINYKFAL